MREYTDYIRVMLKKGDREKIEERMKEAGINNMSAFAHKMLCNGLIIQMDLSDLKEISRLLHINSNNLNQYVKRANETGRIYAADIEDLSERLDVIRDQVGLVLRKFANVT